MTSLLYPGSDIVAECRFVVDEYSLVVDRVPAAEREAVIDSMINELLALQEDDERVEIISGWGSVSCLEGEDLADVLAQGCVFDHDKSSLLLRLLGRCGAWDEDASAVIEEEVEVDQEPHHSLGIAWVRKMVLAGRGMAVVTAVNRFSGGIHIVDQLTQPAPVEVVFVVSSTDHPLFYRTLYSVEDIPEGEFFDVASKAFPNLAFAAKVDFRHFKGTYNLRRPEVVRHLSLINDSFPEVYEAEHGSSRNISMRLGIPVSIEGNNWNIESVMRYIDVEFGGQVYRCEWYSKLEPHQNRIYFHIGDAGTNGRILIGIFHEYLP